MSDISLLASAEYVTASIGDHLFGLPIAQVQDVFRLERLTRVPLASRDIAGVLNLRGRIVTAIDMRARLGLSFDGTAQAPMVVGVDSRGESYGLVFDAIGEVLKLDTASWDTNPVNIDLQIAAVASGIHRLDGRLLIVLDVDRVLELTAKMAA